MSCTSFKLFNIFLYFLFQKKCLTLSSILTLNFLGINIQFPLIKLFGDESKTVGKPPKVYQRKKSKLENNCKGKSQIGNSSNEVCSGSVSFVVIGRSTQQTRRTSLFPQSIYSVLQGWMIGLMGGGGVPYESFPKNFCNHTIKKYGN